MRLLTILYLLPPNFQGKFNKISTGKKELIVVFIFKGAPLKLCLFDQIGSLDPSLWIRNSLSLTARVNSKTAFAQ